MVDNSKFVLLWEIDNATAQLAKGKAESEVFDKEGFKWTAAVQRRDKDGDTTPDFSLRCGVDHNGPWKCEARIDVYILHRDGHAHWTRDQFILNQDNCLWINKKEVVSDWMDLTDQFHKINDKVTFEFHINIISSERGKPVYDGVKFDMPTSRSDVILKIGDVKLHVSKEFLAVHSPVFEALFFGDFAENGKEEWEIKDVVHEEFRDLLNMIYLKTVDITDRSVVHLLKLAHRFQMEHVLNLSKKHIIQSTRLDVMKKLLIADQYRLTFLKDQCFNSFTSATDLTVKLKSAPEYADFSDGMKAALCNKIVELKLHLVSIAETSLTKMEKKEEEGLADRFQSVSIRVVTKEEENEKTNVEKRGNSNENESGKRRENAEKGKRNENEKKLIESREESSDNRESEISLMDLPNEILSHIFTFLDLPSRLKLRLNKRLDRVHFSVKATIDEITFEIRRQDSQLSMENHAPVHSSNCLEWEEALLRFAKNTFVNSIAINLFTVPNEQQCRIIDTLFHFNADVLDVIDYDVAIEVSHLTLPSVLILAENVNHVRVEAICSSLSAKDLCVIRKTVQDGSLMKSFGICLGDGMEKPFMKECFGVAIEDVSEPVPGRIFRSDDDSFELYRDPWNMNFDGDLRTSVNFFTGFLLFEKVDVVEKPDNEFKIQMNQLIPY